ncbi:hypothetical protein AB4083_08880 [Dyella sp. 2RAB6]
MDRQHGIEIFESRTLPTGKPGETEYQFGVYQGENRFGFGCNGTQQVAHDGDRTQRTFVLDLGQDTTLDWALKLKGWLAFPGDDLSFLWGLADGLIKTYQDRTDNYDEDVRYEVVIAKDALQRHGMAAPQGATQESDGQILVAAIDIPMHPLSGVQS